LTANVSSKSQSRILLARKMRERETIIKKNRNQRLKIRNLVGAIAGLWSLYPLFDVRAELISTFDEKNKQKKYKTKKPKKLTIVVVPIP